MVDLKRGAKMAKAKAKPATPKPEERVTVANLKGSPQEWEALKALSEETGVPISEIIRRGIAMWATSRGAKAPAGWAGK